VLQVIMPISPLAGGAGVAELGYLALIGPATAETIRVPSLILWRIATWLIPVAVGGLAFLVRSGGPETAADGVATAPTHSVPAAVGGAALAAPPTAAPSPQGGRPE
jgi:hypothetical protein